MDNLISPLDIIGGIIMRTDNVKESIDSFLEILLTSACGDCSIDPEFGFIFNNMRFEIFDEHEGVIYNSGDTIYDRGIKDVYNKKISGSSKNMNTFAAELKEVVKNYEKRLSDVAVTMTYIREERLIYVTIKGVIIQTKEDYVFTSTLRVWK